MKHALTINIFTKNGLRVEYFWFMYTSASFNINTIFVGLCEGGNFNIL